MDQLNEIVLIDDSAASNVLNERLIEALGITKKISIFSNGLKGWNYLVSCLELNDISAIPTLILLDMNMPVLDGFQFVGKFKKIDSHLTENCNIAVLTTSVDLVQIESLDSVTFSLKKPLMESDLMEIYSKIISK